MAPHIKLAAGGLPPDTSAQCPWEKDVRRNVGKVTKPGLGTDQEGTISIFFTSFLRLHLNFHTDYDVRTELNKSFRSFFNSIVGNLWTRLEETGDWFERT